MPNSELQPNEEAQELGRKLAAVTVDDVIGPMRQERLAGQSRLEADAREFGVQAPLGDVAVIAEEFGWQWELAKNSGGRMVCALVGEGESTEPVPLSLPSNWQAPFGGRPTRMRYYPFAPPFYFELYSDFVREHENRSGIVIESLDGSLKRFQNGLGDFLAYRIAGFGSWVNWMMGRDPNEGYSFTKSPGGPARRPGWRGGSPPPPPPSSAPGGGLPVEVNCSTQGLAIEFSHCYFLHFLNFGAPSSPVKNTLLAGRYVFRGKGPMYLSGTVHSQIFCIPPDYKPVITYF